MGTAVGNKLYARGGWVASGSCSVGFVGVALLVCFARAPWNPGVSLFLFLFDES